MRTSLIAIFLAASLSPVAAAEQKTRQDVILECSQAVKEQIKHPQSFDMHAFSARVEEPGATTYDGWVLEFPFSSQNDFGTEVVMFARCREVKGELLDPAFKDGKPNFGPSKMVVRISER